MKKIMFNDSMGLTQAVLSGRKTMTRRICKEQVWSYSDIVNAENGIFHFETPRYKVGEVVAIAQSYESIYNENGLETMDMLVSGLKNHKGWRNKLFVESDLMPHHIRITDVKAERLQDISDDDCLREGISFIEEIDAFYFERSDKKQGFYYHTAKRAFAALIDKVSGNGTWNSNPWVFAYEFELVD